MAINGQVSKKLNKRATASEHHLFRRSHFWNQRYCVLTNMKFSLACLTILALVVTSTHAFAPLCARRTTSTTSLGPRADVDENEPVVDYPPTIQPGSHDELMYTLGVNLARQLGDVRPLVQSGEELASVAKGLLDTVIGRLSEDGQRQMLAQRGQDLNALITGRA
jgi:hypothetical protein